MSSPPDLSVPGRSCGDCTLCCRLMAIVALDKPQGVWCPHCSTRKRCDLYATRPEECRTFLCGYLTLAGLGEEWKPDKSKIILTAETASRICAVVDPGRPDAWRKEPFYSTLKAWAKEAAMNRGQVLVTIGQRVFVIFPDREVDLGSKTPNQRVITLEHQTPFGLHLDAQLVDKDDPRLAGVTPSAWRIGQKPGPANP